MEPRNAFDDDDGSWLFFDIGEVRLLTAFAPTPTYADHPISLGWAGTPKIRLLLETCLKVASLQGAWHSDHFGPANWRRRQPLLRAVTYGTEKQTHSIPLDSAPSEHDWNEVVGWALGRNENLQLLRLELRHVGDAEEDPDFALWSRLALTDEAAAALPYGSTGIMIRSGDLWRRELEDIVGSFIVRTHIQNLPANDVRDVLRTVVDRFRPTRGLKVA